MAAGGREHVGFPPRFCCHRARADRLQPGSKRMNHWLMKSEPDAFSIDELKRKKQEAWDGVRNYQARNFMRDGMRPGDKVFFYHSNCAVPGIVGIAEVATDAYPDQIGRAHV